MKKFFIKLFVTLGIILAIVGGNYHLYKIGWWEKTLSTTVIPFQWFRTDENKSVSKYSVKNVEVYLAERTGPRAEGNVLSGSAITGTR